MEGKGKNRREEAEYGTVKRRKAISCFLSLRKSIFNYICIYSTWTPRTDYLGKGKRPAGGRREQERASRGLNMIKDQGYIIIRMS